jgi:RNA polymerase sigma-70 factor (ECF subfamily)
VTDGALVEKACAGDAEAFGELVDRHRDAVFRAALAALRDPEEADDVAQDACLLAYRKLSTFRGESSFRTWILSIAWRTALHRRRSWRRWWNRVAVGRTRAADEGAPEAAATDPTPEAAAAGAELAAHVERLLSALPARLRDPLLLLATGDHGYEEMSALLGVPVGTLKWRVSEARRLLKARLVAVGYERD